ncbi:hypothetical protein PVAP13_2NG095746 [Panicum virgatum]|uniref:Uncharacterized protein n=1 Tax=Panicum virgatum TaxID=38727 RepID=A0A8T0VB52_PANVG|nr:hypothetical protein PVAP13_2NG095746 [Panicum virgatum]
MDEDWIGRQRLHGRGLDRTTTFTWTRIGLDDYVYMEEDWISVQVDGQGLTYEWMDEDWTTTSADVNKGLTSLGAGGRGRGAGTAGVEVGAGELGPAAVEVAQGWGATGAGEVGAGELGRRVEVESGVRARSGQASSGGARVEDVGARGSARRGARGRWRDGAAKLGRRVLWRRWSAALGDDDGSEQEAVWIEQRDDVAPAEFKRKS